ncbi:hypothetical protein [Falsiroseomonas sp. E2-1-a20]|uniref:hypothetical protein n=1 Tax=Falsiroseomonas sp. E2-1-a20 TaxID=3239300 RepID=UPI003F32546E
MSATRDELFSSTAIATTQTPEERAKAIAKIVLEKMDVNAKKGVNSRLLATIFEVDTNFLLLPKVFAILKEALQAEVEVDGKKTGKNGSHSHLTLEKKWVADCPEAGWAVKEHKIEKVDAVDRSQVAPVIDEIEEARQKVRKLLHLSQEDRDRHERYLADSARLSTVAKGKPNDMRIMIDKIVGAATAANAAAQKAEDAKRWEIAEMEKNIRDREIAFERDARIKAEADKERMLKLMERWSIRGGMPGDAEVDQPHDNA